MKEDDNFLEKILPQDEISSKKVDQVLRESGLGAQRKWFFKYEITDKAIKITLEEPKKRKPKE